MRGCRRVCIVLSVLLLAASGACPGAAGEGAEPHAEAERAYRRGDIGEAMRRFREAAERGDPGAQARLADILDKAEENDEAAAWYRKSAAQGHPAGLYGLGQMHAAGEGVPRSREAAIKYWDDASGRGHKVATLALARTYESGWGDLKADAALALRYWQRAAAQGDPSAIQRLAAAYRKGELGVAPDPAEAQRWDARLPQEPRK